MADGRAFTAIERARFRRVFRREARPAQLSPDRYPLHDSDPEAAAHALISRLTEEVWVTCQEGPEVGARGRVRGALRRLHPGRLDPAGRAVLATAALVRWIWLIENAFVPTAPGSRTSRPEWLRYAGALRLLVRELLDRPCAFSPAQLGRVVDALARARELTGRWELPWTALLRHLERSRPDAVLRAAVPGLRLRLAGEMRRFYDLGERERVGRATMGEILSRLDALGRMRSAERHAGRSPNRGRGVRAGAGVRRS